MMPHTGGVVLDTPRSISPGSIPAAPMAQTAILPAGDMSAKPQTAVQGTSWTQLSGSASFVAAAPDGSVWALSDQPAGADKYIWHYASGTWTNISGMASRIAVAPDGTLYAINSGGGVYHYVSGNWTSLGGGCSDITVAADGSLYVLSNGKPAGSDQAIWHYTSGWVQAPGSGVRVAASWDAGSYTVSGASLSAGGLYVLNSTGSIYHQNTDLTYVQLPGAASAIAPTTIGGVYVLGYPANANGNSIYYYDLNTPGWTAQAGSGVNISTVQTTSTALARPFANTSGPQLYAIGASGGIYSSPVTASARVALKLTYEIDPGNTHYADVTFTNLTNSAVNVDYIGSGGCVNAGSFCSPFGSGTWNGEMTLSGNGDHSTVYILGGPDPFTYPTIPKVCYNAWFSATESQTPFQGAGSSQCHTP